MSFSQVYLSFSSLWLSFFSCFAFLFMSLSFFSFFILPFPPPLLNPSLNISLFSAWIWPHPLLLSPVPSSWVPAKVPRFLKNVLSSWRRILDSEQIWVYKRLYQRYWVPEKSSCVHKKGLEFLNKVCKKGCILSSSLLHVPGFLQNLPPKKVPEHFNKKVTICFHHNYRNNHVILVKVVTEKLLIA